MSERTLFWFDADLRLADNPALLAACHRTDQLTCVYCVNPDWFRRDRFGNQRMGYARWQFLLHSLASVADGLACRGQRLVLLYGNPVQELHKLITTHNFSRVIQSDPCGWEERQNWQQLQQLCRQTDYIRETGLTLFEPIDLPFGIAHLPETFSAFRRKTEKRRIAQPVGAPETMPPPLDIHRMLPNQLPVPLHMPLRYPGGESNGQSHLQYYFASQAASHYKQTRNALAGEMLSTRFSPWLAQGCISARQVWHALQQYEEQWGASDDSSWIAFELLWREYFHWYARCHGKRLFRFSGLNRKRPLTSYYAQRFYQWCQGKTAWPLVNALMHELNRTGYMSNRGRQIVASCLVNELELDWRCGAGYFEQQLLDYDVGSNWGNWQYIAGVGADPRGGRHFNLSKQTEMFDPEGQFICQWQGELTEPLLDEVDAADWPVAYGAR